MSGLTIGDMGKGSVIVYRQHMIFFLGKSQSLVVFPKRNNLSNRGWNSEVSLEENRTRITTCPVEFALRCD